MTAMMELRSFKGDTDDVKLTAALQYIASLPAASGKPKIVMWEGGGYGPFATGRTTQKGFNLAGINTPSDQLKAGNPYPSWVDLRGTGSWWNGVAGADDFGLADFSVGGQLGKTTLLTGDFHVSKFHNISVNNMKTILGDPSKQVAFTACHFSGFSNFGNCTDTPLTVAGSDNFFWTAGCLFLDSKPSDMKDGTWMIRLAYWSKSHLANVYLTQEGNVGGILCQGDDDNGESTIWSSTIEGRTKKNADTYALMPNVQVEGGEWAVIGCATNFVAPGVPMFNVVGKTGKSSRLTVVASAVDHGLTPEQVVYKGAVGTDLTVVAARRAGKWDNVPSIQSAGAVMNDGTTRRVG